MQTNESVKGNDLWQSFKQGNRDSFASIYKNNFGDLYAYASHYMDDDSQIEDAIHDLFVKLWLRRSQLGHVANIKAYLLCSLRNTLINLLKRKKRFSLLDPEILRDDIEPSYPVEDGFIQEDRTSYYKHAVDNALTKIGCRQKEVLYLHYYEGLSYKEVADIMHITVKAVYKLNARSLEHFKKILPDTILTDLVN